MYSYVNEHVWAHANQNPKIGILMSQNVKLQVTMVLPKQNKEGDWFAYRE